MIMSFSIWQRIHGSSTPFLLVCVIISTCSLQICFVCVKGAVQAPRTCRLVKMRQHSVAVIKQKDLELLKKPALKPAGGHRAAGCAEKQKWALMRTTKRNYLPTNKHSSPDTVAIVWPTNCQKFVCSALQAPHASPILNKNCGILILYQSLWHGTDWKALVFLCATD